MTIKQGVFAFIFAIITATAMTMFAQSHDTNRPIKTELVDVPVLIEAYMQTVTFQTCADDTRLVYAYRYSWKDKKLYRTKVKATDVSPKDFSMEVEP